MSASPDTATGAPARPDRRAARRQATKDEIIAAAWELVRELGLAGLVMRDLGERVGMKAQSLYSYFGSKHEIYDAMFHQGYLAFAATLDDLPDTTTNDTTDDASDSGADVAHLAAHRFFDFCICDPARFQLLFQRTIPDFVPSDESYAVALSVYDAIIARMAGVGIDDPATVDLWTALLTGLVDQQLSNDPGGDRWDRLVDRAVDMFLTVNAPHLLEPTPKWTQT